MKITLNNICKFFDGTDGPLQILKNFSTELEQGRGYAILGPSGSGKTSLLQIISGIDKRFSGQITYQSIKERHRPRFGLIFQSDNLLSTLSIIENVALASMLVNIEKKEAWNLAEKLLDQVGLENRKNFFPATLSQGQRTRAAIARGLANKPDFVIADEPTASLDRKTANTIIDLLLKIKLELGVGLIVGTHDTILAEKLENKIFLESATH